MAETNRPPQWWEKTVEYAFVLRFLTDADSAIPLDGNPEKALGDLITKAGDTFRLIEFKARAENIADEKRKWGFGKDTEVDGKKSWKADESPFHEILCTDCPPIIEAPGHAAHWLIYGRPTGLTFELVAQRYSEGVESAMTLLTSKSEGLDDSLPGSSTTYDALEGVSYAEMVDYMDLLESERGAAGVGTGGLVLLGVEGGGIFGITVEEFRRTDPNYVPKYRPTRAKYPVPTSRPTYGRPRG